MLYRAIGLNVNKSGYGFCGDKVKHILLIRNISVYLWNFSYYYAFGYRGFRAYLYAVGYAGHYEAYV